jgi:hypothetical protein
MPSAPRTGDRLKCHTVSPMSPDTFVTYLPFPLLISPTGHFLFAKKWVGVELLVLNFATIPVCLWTLTPTPLPVT